MPPSMPSKELGALVASSEALAITADDDELHVSRRGPSMPEWGT